MSHDIPNRLILMNRPRPTRKRKPRVKPKHVARVYVRFECPVCGGPHSRADHTTTTKEACMNVHGESSAGGELRHERS